MSLMIAWVTLEAVYVHCVRVGSSIVVTTERVSSVYNKLINNPQCFILYNTSEIPFLEVTDVST